MQQQSAFYRQTNCLSVLRYSCNNNYLSADEWDRKRHFRYYPNYPLDINTSCIISIIIKHLRVLSMNTSCVTLLNITKIYFSFKKGNIVFFGFVVFSSVGFSIITSFQCPMSENWKSIILNIVIIILFLPLCTFHTFTILAIRANFPSFTMMTVRIGGSLCWTVFCIMHIKFWKVNI